MFQVFLVSLLQVLVSFLEASFSAKKHFKFASSEDDNFFHSHHHGDSSFNHQDAETANTRKLHHAYTVLQLTPPCTMEEVRRQWKTLSRRYHPDRNPGKENHEKQQQINEAMDFIQSILERDQNIDHGDSEDEKGTQEENVRQSEYDSKQRSQSSSDKDATRKTNSKIHTKHNQKMRKRGRKKAMKRQREEQREKLRQEVLKEKEQERQHWRKIQEERKKIKRTTRSLSNVEERKAASRLFMQEVERHKFYDAEQTTSFETHRRIEKPKHYVMESCTNDLVIAMRLGMEQFAGFILDDRINNDFSKLVNKTIQNYNLEGRSGRIDLNELYRVVVKDVVLEYLDDDKNTLLHYAVYWECHTMIGVLCDVAYHYGLLEDIFVAKDASGNTPMDLGWVSMDTQIMILLKNYNFLIERHRERTLVGPAMKKAAKQLYASVRSNFDSITVLNSIVAFFIGTKQIRFHWIFSLIAVVALQCPYIFLQVLTGEESTSMEKSSAKSAPFLTALAVMKGISVLGQMAFTHALFILRNIFAWDLFFIIFTLCIGGCCAGCFRPGRLIEWLEVLLFYWTWAIGYFLYKPLASMEFASQKFWQSSTSVKHLRPALLQTSTLAALLIILPIIRYLLMVCSVGIALVEIS